MIKHVVVAIIFNAENKILISQRPKGKPYANYWEFPGGKVEPGETPFQALIRELFEELDIEVLEARPWIEIPYTYPHQTVLLETWIVKNFQNTAIGKEGQPIRWVSLAETSQYQFPEGNFEILSQLQKLAKD